MASALTRRAKGGAIRLGALAVHSIKRLTDARRRRRRFGELGVGEDGPPRRSLRLRCACDSPGCAGAVEALARICRPFGPEPGTGALGPLAWTAMALDLAQFADGDAYVRAVSKATGGRYRRSANKAARLGYVVRPIDEDAFAGAAARIRSSALWRSRGLVLEALRRRRASDMPDRDAPMRVARCPEHWTRAWGVFGPLGDDAQALVARAVLRRSGEIVAIDHFMGQVELLKEGVTKLLLFEILRWLKDPAEPAAAGARCAVYGPLERGGDGLLDFQRYALFAPLKIDLADDAPFAPPAGFDPKTYLRLNPDVEDAGVEPLHHFIYHGLAEGRRWRDGD
ncbi:MAG: hypothetical protein KGI57_05710 [Hyphomicrobiales bacterium]|nr:hypothetical protein [Hyphomicrobiales bacterium]